MEFTKKNLSQKRSIMTTDAIVEAAARILEGSSLKSFTTNNIAKLAGVSIGSLYQYFADKESIINQLLYTQMQKNLETLFASLSKEEPNLEKLVDHLVNTQFDAWKERSGLSKAVLRFAPQIIHADFIKRNNKELVSLFRQKLEEYKFTELPKENLDLKLLNVINIVRVSILTYYLDTSAYDYETVKTETQKVIKSYLLK